MNSQRYLYTIRTNQFFKRNKRQQDQMTIRIIQVKTSFENTIYPANTIWWWNCVAMAVNSLYHHVWSSISDYHCKNSHTRQSWNPWRCLCSLSQWGNGTLHAHVWSAKLVTSLRLEFIVELRQIIMIFNITYLTFRIFKALNRKLRVNIWENDRKILLSESLLASSPDFGLYIHAKPFWVTICMTSFKRPEISPSMLKHAVT